MKKHLVLWLMVLAMLLSLVACAGTEGDADDPDEDETTTDSDDEGEEPSEDQITISFWKWIPTEGSQTDDLLEQWQEDFPNITLDIVHVGESESHFQRLSAALPSGEGPSVLALQVGARANQYREFCEPLRPMAEEKWGSDWEDMFLQAALEQCRYSGDDYRVLPGGMTATPVIQYNATAFAELGFTEAPETMEDVYAVIEASKENPNIIPGVGIGAKEGWTCRDVFMGLINQIAPGDVYAAQEGELAWTEPQFVEAFTIWQDLFESGFFAEGSLGVSLYPDINDNFAMAGTGESDQYYIMQNCGTWHGSGLTTRAVEEGIEEGTRSPDLTIGMFTLPPVKEGVDPNMVVTVDVAWGVNADKPDAEKDAAFEFVAWMAAGQGQTIWSNSLQVLPSAKNVDLSEAIDNLYGETEVAALEMCQYYVENNAGPREIRYPEIATALEDALVAVAGGLMTPEEACDLLESASQSTNR